MPSPVGHALAGVAVVWIADLIPGQRAWRTAPSHASWYRRAGNGLTLACVALALMPDLDLLARVHRTITHSVAAVALAGVVGAAAAARVRRPIVRVGLMCAAAYGTHLLLDWLAVDVFEPYGLQALWPFKPAFYHSGWDVFRQTARQDVMDPANIRKNVLAISQEIALLAPLVVLVWSVRVKALKRFSTEVARRHHPAE